jgi:hypothetical protein
MNAQEVVIDAGRRYVGPSEVRVLPVQRCRRAAWQRFVATINGVIFLLLLFSFWFGYFSPGRRLARVLNFCMRP